MPPRAPRSATRAGALSRVAHRRLQNLFVAAPGPETPEAVVARLGAAQSQDVAAATWALGLRAAQTTEADVHRACDEGRILRTHVLRPTWHFVLPQDIRALLALTAPRVHAANASIYRRVGVDAVARSRTQRAIARALAGGRHLTRAELQAVLARAGFPTDARRLAFIAMAAELDAVICSGPRRGRETTYALLDERARVPAAISTDRALEELARRYFRSHGPATLRDFAWWSGLTVADARRAVEMLAAAVVAEHIGSCTYYVDASAPSTASVVGTVHLLPAYDEFIVAYRDREAVPYAFYGATRPLPYLNPLVAGGLIVGTWGRVKRATGVVLDVVLQRRLTRRERESLELAVARYAGFLRQPVRATVRGQATPASFSRSSSGAISGSSR